MTEVSRGGAKSSDLCIRDDVCIRVQVPVRCVGALSFGPFGIRSEATNKRVGELGWGRAGWGAKRFGRAGIALYTVGQKAGDPKPRADTLRGEGREGGVVRASVATGA